MRRRARSRRRRPPAHRRRNKTSAPNARTKKNQTKIEKLKLTVSEAIRRKEALAQRLERARAELITGEAIESSLHGSADALGEGVDDAARDALLARVRERRRLDSLTTSALSLALGDAARTGRRARYTRWRLQVLRAAALLFVDTPPARWW